MFLIFKALKTCHYTSTYNINSRFNLAQISTRLFYFTFSELWEGSIKCRELLEICTDVVSFWLLIWRWVAAIFLLPFEFQVITPSQAIHHTSVFTAPSRFSLIGTSIYFFQSFTYSNRVGWRETFWFWYVWRHHAGSASDPLLFAFSTCLWMTSPQAGLTAETLLYLSLNDVTTGLISCRHTTLSAFEWRHHKQSQLQMLFSTFLWTTSLRTDSAADTLLYLALNDVPTDKENCRHISLPASKWRHHRRSTPESLSADTLLFLTLNDVLTGRISCGPTSQPPSEWHHQGQAKLWTHLSILASE